MGTARPRLSGATPLRYSEPNLKTLELRSTRQTMAAAATRSV